jgi:hypothetical protein
MMPLSAELRGLRLDPKMKLISGDQQKVVIRVIGCMIS